MMNRNNGEIDLAYVLDFGKPPNESENRNLRIRLMEAELESAHLQVLVDQLKETIENLTRQTNLRP